MKTNPLEKEGLIASILEAVPPPIFLVDEDVRVFWSNHSAVPLMGMPPDQAFFKRCGEVMYCLHAVESAAGCGHTEFCKDCIIRNSVRQTFDGQRVVRQRSRMIMMGREQMVEINMLVTTAPFAYKDASLVLLILEDISEIMELQNIVPICAYCKKIRDDEAFWQSVEKYFKKRLNLNFSHGVCPDCLKRVLPDLHD
jgi:PAS domain-containing protein